MQRAFKIVLTLFLLLTIPVSINGKKAEGSALFPDVSAYRNEILFLSGRGIISGYPDGNFGPQDPIKRIQAVQMIIKELGIKTGDAPNPNFKDVTPGSYGYDVIAKAKQLGIISGKGAGMFDPNGTLTRSQMAIILVNAYKLKGISYSSFKDVPATASTYPFVQALAAHNITTGYPDGTFRPNATMIRAHFAAFMARFLNEDFKPFDMAKAPVRSTEEIAKNEQSVVVIELYDENDELVSQGSGFIVANQLVATNFHVISGGTRAVAITESGEEFELEGVVKYDEYLDIAILKPAERIGFPSLPLASFSSAVKGEKAVAIGSPFGLKNTISEGIVSGKQTFEDDMGSLKAIQTTAQITFGSSGGPLLNMKGYVLGLNSFGFEDINFAISSDYVSEFLTDYKKVDFKKIKTERFTEMPVLDYEEDEEWNEDEVEEELPEPVDLEPFQGTKQTLSDIFLDAVHDSELPVVYGINEDGALIAVNYETKSIKRLPFSLPAESVFYDNGELYVTLLKGEHSSYWWNETQNGAVAIVDPQTLKIKKYFDINVDPYDIVADENYFYVSSGSGQWTYLKSYNKETGAEVSSKSIRQQSELFMHPDKKRVYAVNSDTSPRDMEVFTVENGIFTGGYDSPYHGDYPLDTYMTISPDGRYLFNHAGTVFRSTALKDTNMKFFTDLKTGFSDVKFNTELTEFYLTVGDRIYVYDYETFTPIKTYSLSGEGYFLFNHKGKLVVLGEEVSQSTGIWKTFIMRAQ
ncbi:trypsin-like serine protease [Bacillus infantis]|uniref:S-layer homology domain-containing protein n=1 Tax=Bacillus infantis TaxID=324767 RepID=UPI00101C150A|nr:S-layer homology domain-containing protein [Bacillus infantis]RYI28838.1 trypsin-like serine protease [Bacillus infantis]